MDAYQAITDDPKTSWIDFERSWMAKINAPCVFISAVEKQNIALFKSTLIEMITKLHMQRYPNYNN
jgi:GTP-binding protein HflX